MTETRPRDIGMLVFLGAIWGTTFMFLKLAVEGFTPFTLVFARMALTAVILVVYVYAAGQRLPTDRATWKSLLIVGAISSGIPFVFVAWGMRHLDSGVVAIIMGLVPVVTVLLAHYARHDEKLNLRKIAGAVAAFSGLVALVGPRTVAGLQLEVTAIAACFVSSLFYGATTVFVRSIRAIPPLTIGTGSAIVAAGLTLFPALLFEHPWTLDPGPRAWFGVIAVAALPTAAGTVLYYRLVSMTSATFGSAVNYLIPLFGVAWGVIVLGERPGQAAAAALALILAGVWLINRGQNLSARRAAGIAEPPA